MAADEEALVVLRTLSVTPEFDSSKSNSNLRRSRDDLQVREGLPRSRHGRKQNCRDSQIF
jgi:hypothetical protein